VTPQTMANLERTITQSLKIGVPVGAGIILAEVVLNRTGLSEGKKALAVAGVTTVAGLALAGKAPNLAPALLIIGIAYSMQAAARKSRIDQRADEIVQEKLAAAETAARTQVQNQQNQQQGQGAQPTPPAAPQPTPAPTAGLNAPRNNVWSGAAMNRPQEVRVS